MPEKTGPNKWPIAGDKIAFLVYQAGIANIFATDSLDIDRQTLRRRLMQSDFRTCEVFARGLGVAGVHVISAHCNNAGDIISAQWDLNLDNAPFRDAARPVFANVSRD